MGTKCKNCGSSITPIQEVGPGFGGKGWCVYCEDSMPKPKDARIAALESALAKAEEVIKTVRDRAMEHPLCAYDNTVEEVEREGGDLAFVTNDVWRPLDAALAAIKETRRDPGE